jgi:catechol 2,3-dioxygenase
MAISSNSTPRRNGTRAPEDLPLALRNQAQRYPGRGVNVRRLDHFNLAVDIRANREFFQSALGFRLTEQIVLESGEEAGMWLTFHPQEF